MKEVYIKLQTINDVRKLVSVVEKYPFSVDLSEGRYLVDAKSLMGIFSLDLLQPIKLIAEKDDPNLFEELKTSSLRCDAKKGRYTNPYTGRLFLFSPPRQRFQQRV